MFLVENSIRNIDLANDSAFKIVECVLLRAIKVQNPYRTKIKLLRILKTFWEVSRVGNSIRFVFLLMYPIRLMYDETE